mmetsp:Transcript_27773/g.31731  ORF Transcript_27773/g.31731 Transcript_27773/m.31731 type:complete len:300 (-) Transcript_27773:82-981(-)|eukprot:CAMPEP_0194142900 /NCGR_PEP_ID=MMETSP0152-20130528/12112_1 /TAXON_ID=1049557 /ORGANISM="Thalassiothrix antarctica, Strain L6-D1" /LENGTH=299 /DNA_ID=CAMNT_0038842051 /DNA_START=20 /DNA_END=919 /DNA_ORIENTATION=+
MTTEATEDADTKDTTTTTMDLTSLGNSLENDILNNGTTTTNEKENNGSIIYSDDELDVMRKVKQRLIEEDGLSYVNPKFLAYTVIVSKSRLDDSLDKYRKFLKATSKSDMKIVESDEEMWNDPSVESFLHEKYCPCGVDNDGRQIMWINGGDNAITEELEKTSIRAGILYTMAIHSDNKSLREGITFVIDTSKQGSKPKIGNESRVQKINQSYPLRPQAIYLAGSSMATRIFINGLIKIASLFTKQKILSRIKFVTIEQAIDCVPKESAPTYVGGMAGHIEDVVQWTKDRLQVLPIPEL